MAAATAVGLADSPSLAASVKFTELNVANTAQESGFGCTTGSSRPYIRTLTPTLRGRVTNPSQTISEVWFVWQKLDPTTNTFADAGSAHLDAVPSNSIAQIMATGLVEGGIYNFRMQDHEGRPSDSAGEGYCEFALDTVAPNPPSSVTSTRYPDDGSFHGSVGKTGDFRINPPATAPDDVKHYVYALTPYTSPPTDGTRTVPAGADHGATIQLNPTMGGSNELRVWSVDKAGNISPLASPVAYRFRVGDPSRPVAEWTADEPAGATALTDQSNAGNDAAASNVTFGVPSRIMDGPTAARFNGVDSYATTAGPVVDTSRSFTIAAWLRLESASNPQTAISFAGNHQSSFHLYYDNTTNQWGFSANPADEPTTNPNNTTVLSTSQATTNEWTHLTASYDSAAKQMRLYVNGELSGTTTIATAWTATAPVQIGRHFHNDTYTNYWNGDLDNISVYQGTLSPDKIRSLAVS